jgi:hypothetical protein
VVDVENRWQWIRLRTLTAVTIGVALVLSFSSIKQLAVHAGWGQRSWLFPILVDVVAAAAYEVWMSVSPARKPAARLAAFAVASSLTANVTDWWINQATVLAAVLGALPPIMLAWLLYVVHVHRSGVLRQALDGLSLAEPEPAHAPPVDEAPVVQIEHAAEPVDPHHLGAVHQDEVAPNGRVHHNGAVRPAPAPLSTEWMVHHTAPSEALVPQSAVLDRLNQVVDREEQRPDPEVVHQARALLNQAHTGDGAPMVRPEEAELVALLREHDPAGAWSRRTAEDRLSEWAGERIGSSRASRMLAAARAPGGAR